MTQPIDREREAPKDGCLEERNRRLEALVGGLLETNQELRFKLASLESEAERLKRGLKDATAGAGMLF